MDGNKMIKKKISPCRLYFCIIYIYTYIFLVCAAVRASLGKNERIKEEKMKIGWDENGLMVYISTCFSVYKQAGRQQQHIYIDILKNNFPFILCYVFDAVSMVTIMD